MELMDFWAEGTLGAMAANMSAVIHSQKSSRRSGTHTSSAEHSKILLESFSRVRCTMSDISPPIGG
jgi:hypothetical protein